MTEPGGSPGSGWDVRLDLGSVGTPLAGPSGNASPTGDAAGTHARRKSGDFAGTSPRADGAASGSSSSPDENVSARSNPPSPRDRSPRSRSPRPPSPSDEDDPHRAQQHSTPSPVARRSVTPLPFEQRRRDALAAKQRRLDGMMGKLSAVRTGREASPAGSVGSAESDDTHDGDDDAVDRPSASAEPRRTVTPPARHGAGRASTRATREPRWAPPSRNRRARTRTPSARRSPTGARPSPTIGTTSSRTLAATSSRRPPPNKSKTRERSRAPRHSRRRPPRRRGPRCLPLFRNLPREGEPRREIRQFPKRRRKRRRRRRRRKHLRRRRHRFPSERARFASRRRRADRRVATTRAFSEPPRARPRTRAPSSAKDWREVHSARADPKPASSGSIATSRSNPRRRPRRRRRRSRRLARRTRRRSVAFSRLTI